MIQVKLLQDENGYCGFLCEGHAGYAQGDEEDILCSAVTALAGTTVSSLTDILHKKVEFDFQSGRLFCRIRDKEIEADRKYIDFLFETFRLGCEQIAFSYGSQYVKVIDSERVS